MTFPRPRGNTPLVDSGRHLYIDTFAGLANRLETLALARVIQETHGHTITVDWPETDALAVPYATARPLSWWNRRTARRLTDCSPETFATLGNQRRLLLRTIYSPDSLIAPHYRRAFSSLQLRRDLRDALTLAVGPHTTPVVGVHLRQGDFAVTEGTYDTVNQRHPALPLAWVISAMDFCAKAWPGCRFFLSLSGSASAAEALRARFDIFQSPVLNPYTPSIPGHAAATHPVLDLFGLAGCDVLIATPLSSFSHVAAHALGPETLCLVPPPVLQPGETTLRRLSLTGKPLRTWVDAFRRPESVFPTDVGDVARDIPQPGLRLDWIPVF